MSLYAVDFNISDSDSVDAPMPFIIEKQKPISNTASRSRARTKIQRTRNIEVGNDRGIQQSNTINVEKTQSNEENTVKEENIAKIENENEFKGESPVFNLPDGTPDMSPIRKAPESRINEERKFSKSQKIPEKVGEGSPIIKEQMVETSYEPKQDPEHIITKTFQKTIDYNATYPVYNVVRERKSGIMGKRIFYSFKELDKTYFAAKIKSKSTRMIKISKGNIAHISSSPDYVLLGDGHDFSLRVKSEVGKENASIRFLPSTQDGLQRTTIVSVYSEKHEPALYTSALPFDCCPEVDQRFARKSVKNAVFANEGGENVMWVWKHADDVLKVEAHFEIHPIILFAISLASYLSVVR